MRQRLAAGLIASAVTLTMAAPPQPGPERAPVVFVLPIDGMIDLGLAPFLARAIRDAEAADAARCCSRPEPRSIHRRRRAC